MTILKKGQPPVEGESIFGFDEPMQLNGCVDLWRGDWLAYASGYRQLAIRCWDHLSIYGSLMDTEVLPLTYLWRHYLELMLKALLHVIDGVPPELFRSHSLGQLWPPVSAAIQRQQWGAMADADFRLVAGVIANFDALDARSFDFRYPGNQGRTEVTLAEAPPHINARRLSERMIWVADNLEAAFDALTGGDGQARVPETRDSMRRRMARIGADTNL